MQAHWHGWGQSGHNHDRRTGQQHLVLLGFTLLVVAQPLNRGSCVPAVLVRFCPCSELGLMACSRKRLYQWDMTERFCKHQVRTGSKPEYGQAPVTHVAVQWHWVFLDLPGGIELSPQSCWRIKTNKQKKMDEPVRIMVWPLEECGLNLIHSFHIHSPFWMSFSWFYCSEGKEMFWEKKMLLRVHFWPSQGVKWSRFPFAAAAGISVSLLCTGGLKAVFCPPHSAHCLWWTAVLKHVKLVWVSVPREDLACRPKHAPEALSTSLSLPCLSTQTG